MKITFLAPEASLSGGARVISIYARELAARGCDVKVIIPKGRKRTWRSIARQLKHGNFDFRHVWPRSHYDPIEHLVHRLDRLGPITERDCPDADAIIATWWETAEWMLTLPSQKGRKIHFVQHYEAFYEGDKPRVDAVLAAPIEKITICSWLFDLLTVEFGAKHVAMIPNGVDLEQFNAPPRSRQMQPTVGMLYHSADFKKTRNGIAAFKLLSDRFPDSRLIMFGEQPPLESLPLPKNAFFQQSPEQDELKSIYAACDVWVCPSDEEGFYLPLLEAMACRCPVISTPVGGPKDIIAQGVNGFLVPKNDVPALAAQLLAFFEMEEPDWQRMSDNAYATALAREWTKSVDQFLAVLNEGASVCPAFIGPDRVTIV